MLDAVSFSLDEETRQQKSSGPSPETAFNVMVKRRHAEVKVSILSAEQMRVLTGQLNTFVNYSFRRSALMQMRWVVTLKSDGQLQARLMVQRFTYQRLRKVPTSSPTASRRSRQIFPALVADLGCRTHTRAVRRAFPQCHLDEQPVHDEDANFTVSIGLTSVVNAINPGENADQCFDHCSFAGVPPSSPRRTHRFSCRNHIFSLVHVFWM